MISCHGRRNEEQTIEAVVGEDPRQAATTLSALAWSNHAPGIAATRHSTRHLSEGVVVGDPRQPVQQVSRSRPARGSGAAALLGSIMSVHPMRFGRVAGVHEIHQVGLVRVATGGRWPGAVPPNRPWA